MRIALAPLIISIALVTVLPLAGIVLFVAMDDVPNACITEVVGRAVDISGHDFEVSDTNCDLLAKTETITLFVSRAGESSKVAILGYVPGKGMLPLIESIDRNTVRISLSSITALNFYKESWDGLSIVYHIDGIRHLDLPAGKRQ